MADDPVNQAVNDAVVATREKVHGYLSGAFDDVDMREGVWHIPYGSAMVDIEVRVFDEDSSVVHIEAPLVTGATVSPELFQHVATGSYEHSFGHLGVRETGDGKATITFSHSLLGDHLDDAELRTAVIAVAFTSDELDDGLAAQFGGEVYNVAGNT